MISKKHRMDRERKLGNQIYKYLASYVVLLMIPCLFGWGTYTYFYREMLNEYHNTALSDMKGAIKEIDDSMDRMIHYFDQISYTPQLRQYMGDKSGYNKSQLVNVLKIYSESNRFVDDYGLWDGENDMIYTPDGHYGTEVYFSWMLGSKNVFQGKQDISGILSRMVQYEDAEQNTFVYICPLRSLNMNITNAPYAFFYILRENELKGLLQQQEGEISISLGRPDELGVRQYKDMTWYSVWSADTDVAISVSMNHDSFPERLGKQRITFTLLMLVTVLVSIALSVWMSINNVKPIRKLLVDLLPYRIGKGKTDSNEIRRIADIMDDILNVSDQMGKRINEQKNMLRQQSLMLLLSGNYDQSTLETLNRIGIEADDRPCFVALFFSKKQINDTILEILERLIYPTGFEVNIVEMEGIDAIAALVILDKDSGEERKRFVMLFQNAAQEYRLSIGVNIGGVVSGIEKASVSLSEAQSLGVDGEDIRFFYPSNSRVPVWQNESSRAMICLIQALRNGNEPAMDGFVDEVFAEIDGQANDLMIRRCAYYEMFNSLIHEFATLNVEVDFEGTEHYINSMRREEYAISLKSMLHSACMQVQQQTANSNERRTDEIIQFVMEHLSDADLCIDLLIEQFDISANQISRIFRQKTGYGFREYLISQRMLKAKELLMGSDKSITEISAITGYTNSSYFIKTFKTYYGMTPVQYKKQAENISHL